MLQDTGAATYDSTETGYWIEESLKEFATYDPNIVNVIFKIESRTGTDVTGTEDSLTDTVKDQFLTTDPTNEKVVHNTTDNTWAVVLTRTSAEVMTLSADIMDENENYAIYNKRCRNSKQIYIGDVTDFLWVDSVEYPIGTKRNFKVYGDVLEILVDSVADSNLNVTTIPNVDVLVRFAKPHKMCVLSTLSGQVNNGSGIAANAVAMAIDGFYGTEVIAVGEVFTMANKRFTYTVTMGVTLSGGGGTIKFFPRLEDAAVDEDTVLFPASTLKPQHEEIFCHLVAARAMLSDANAQLIQVKADMTTGRALVNAINKGGVGVPDTYLAYSRAEESYARGQMGTAERKLAEVLGKLEKLSISRTKRTYPRD